MEKGSNGGSEDDAAFDYSVLRSAATVGQDFDGTPRYEWVDSPSGTSPSGEALTEDGDPGISLTVAFEDVPGREDVTVDLEPVGEPRIIDLSNE